MREQVKGSLGKTVGKGGERGRGGDGICIRRSGRLRGWRLVMRLRGRGGCLGSWLWEWC
jgi:hypothetical protein